MRIWIASLAAVAVQPLVFAGRIAPDYFASRQPMNGVGILLLSIIVVAAAMVLLLGIPTFFLLSKFQSTGWTSLAIAGFLLGALPVAALSWPRNLEGYSSSQNWHGKFIAAYINGVPTKYAWLTYGENMVFFGLHGLVGALIFYAVWRRQDRLDRLIKQT
jgi:hypothetical protein